MAGPVRRSRRFLRGRWSPHVAWPLAVAFGVYWGHATVGAFRPDYLPASRSAEFRNPAMPVATGYAEAQALVPAGCGGDCSDYDLGYRWASVSDADAAGECYDASWSFRRGCLAYLRAEGRFVSAPEPEDFAVPVYHEAPVYRAVRGEAARDADVQPSFDDDGLTLAAVAPTIAEHGSLPPANGPISIDAPALAPALPANALVAPPAPAAVAPQPASDLL